MTMKPLNKPLALLSALGVALIPEGLPAIGHAGRVPDGAMEFA